MAEKIDIGVNTGGAAADIGKVEDALGDLGQTVGQVQADLADLAKSLNGFISAKAALAGKAPRLLDLTADKAALEELRDSIKDVISQNPSIKRHIDVANGKNANITSPSQINLQSISASAQGQSQFIERFITRLIARNQSAGKNKIDTGLTSQELLTPGEAPRPGPKPDPFQKATGLLGAIGKVASQAVQGGAGGWAGQAAGSILQGAAAAKASGAGGMGMLKGGGIAAAAFTAYKVASAVDEGLDRAKEEAIGVDKFKRQLGDVGVGFDALRENVRAAADGLGLTYKESLKLTGLFASTSNMSNKDTTGLSAESRIANSFARATGVANEETAKFFGEMRYTGATDTQQDSKRMALAMADAIKRTGSSVNTDQMLQSISSYAAQIKDATLGSANALGFADLLSGVMGDHKTKASTAAGLINQFDAGVRSGGVNDAGQAYQFQALDGQRLGFGRFQALKEGGMFGSEKSRLGGGSLAGDLYGPLEGATDKTTGAKIMDQINRDFFSKGDERSKVAGIDALATQYFGGSHSKAMAFEKSFAKHGGDVGLNTTASMLGRAKIDPTNFNAEGTTLLSDLANAKDRPEVESLRQSMLQRKGLTEKEKVRIEQAGANKDMDGMRLELARVAASMGQESNQGKQLVDAAVNTENALTKFASQLIPISIASRDLLGSLVEKFAPHSEALSALKRGREATQRTEETKAISDGTLLPADADRLNKTYDDRIERILLDANLSKKNKSLADKEKMQANVDAVNRARGFELGQFANAKAFEGLVNPEKANLAVAQGVGDKAKFEALEAERIKALPSPASLTTAAGVTQPQPKGQSASGSLLDLTEPAASRSNGGGGKAGDKAAEAYSFFREKGWTDAQATGLVANLQAESNFNEKARGDKTKEHPDGAAAGIAQWHPDRQKNFKERYGKSINESTYREQLEFVNYELTEGGEKNAGSKLKDARTKEEATGVVMHYYERPADKIGEATKRIRLAQSMDFNNPPKEPPVASLTKPLDPAVANKERSRFAETDPRRVDMASSNAVKTPEGTPPIQVPQGNPQAAAEAKRHAYDFTFDPIMFSANVTLKDANGKPAADPVMLSGKVGKPTGSGARPL